MQKPPAALIINTNLKQLSTELLSRSLSILEKGGLWIMLPVPRETLALVETLSPIYAIPVNTLPFFSERSMYDENEVYVCLKGIFQQ